jgi:hypothetical protein
MMHEECDKTQNYRVADTGEDSISHPLISREMGVGWQRFAVEKRVSPLRFSR